MPLPPHLTFQHLGPEHARAIADRLVAVYAETYDVPPYIGDAFFSVESYAARLDAAFDMAGFEAATAHSSDTGELVGYVHGVTLPADRAWWVSLTDHRPTEVVNAANAGRVFWLRELMVLPKHTNQGIGRAIHDEVVRGRTEPWTTLTCIVDNQPARDAYPRWGYRVIGKPIRHAPESPLYDAMILPPAPA